ncbi:MAG: hypothetical protein K2M91_06345 [Lachnospiraceae bacterium]|nr:hypothetical protein [Lachnospiraceae bacterium]
MKEKIKGKILYLVRFIPVIMVVILIGARCYDKYITKTKELVIDQCIVRGVSYDGNKTLLVVELPDHELAIVDGSIYRSRQTTARPKVRTGQNVRCRWKYGDTGKLGYSNWREGDILY